MDHSLDRERKQRIPSNYFDECHFISTWVRSEIMANLANIHLDFEYEIIIIKPGIFANELDNVIKINKPNIVSLDASFTFLEMLIKACCVAQGKKNKWSVSQS